MYHIRYNNIPVSALYKYRELVLDAITAMDKGKLPPEVEYTSKEAAEDSLESIADALDLPGDYTVHVGDCPYLTGLYTWKDRSVPLH